MVDGKCQEPFELSIDTFGRVETCRVDQIDGDVVKADPVGSLYGFHGLLSPMGASKQFQFVIEKALDAETDAVGTKPSDAREPFDASAVGIGLERDFSTLLKIGAECGEDGFVECRIDRRRRSAANENGFDRTLFYAVRFQLVAKLKMKGFHVSLFEIEFSHIGVETAVVTFGIAERDMNIQKVALFQCLSRP